MTALYGIAIGCAAAILLVGTLAICLAIVLGAVRAVRLRNPAPPILPESGPVTPLGQPSSVRVIDQPGPWRDTDARD